MNEVAERTANPFGASAPHAASGLVSVEQQKAIAEVQAALIMARAQPRDQIAAMDKILQDCTRPSLAEKATFQYSRGGNDIDGPTIRLAETIARRWGNLETGVKELSRRREGACGVSECMSYAWDLETNYREVKTFSVRHWRDTKQGGYALKDERDIYELIANYGARRKRACILAVVDGDVVEAAVHQCDVTLRTKVEITPESIAAMIGKFAELGVSQEMLEARIQRRVESITPALVVQLRKIHNSLRDGMSVAGDWFDLPSLQTTTEDEPSGTRTETVKARMRKKQPAPATKQAEPATPAPPVDKPVEDEPAQNGADFSYAEIAERIEQAKTVDALDDAADLIGAIAVPEQRAELLALYRAKRLQIPDGE